MVKDKKMTTYDLERQLENMGFAHDTKLTYKLGDTRVFIHNELLSISDGLTRLVGIPLDTILTVYMDWLANMLVVVFKKDEKAFMV